ncbi:uncharacterized protein LOC135649273 isoform X2 [Musa acuminata AAA Group]|uniref:uncharacterized protein LOC103973664 isoform X2 n=1 Tax=Musa acuminata AAA Group TaxID=214697 RepID=UPI0031D0FB7A
MLESFFSARPRQGGAPEAVPPVTLLSGPPSCGKTSLLFQFAINRASETNGDVVFICNKRRLEYKPPFLSQDIDPAAELLERIQMKSCQHKYGNARGRDLAMARTMALCQDAIAYANQKQQAQRLCNLLLADTHQGDSPRLLFIYKRWVQCILTIQGDISGSFILKYSSISGNHLAKTRTAKYSIALQSLLLEVFES